MNLEPKLAWSLVLAYCAVIFAASSVPGQPLGYGIDPFLVFIITSTGHFLEYSVLGFFLYVALTSSKVGGRSAVLFSFVFAFLYALSDEFHQSFVPYRDPSLSDLAFDLGGAYVGAVFGLNTKKRQSIKPWKTSKQR